MIELLKSILTGHNQFASGGLLLMLLGGLGVYLRTIPENLWHWFLGQMTMSITVQDEDCAFVWVKEWFLEQRFVKRIRRVDLDTTVQSERSALIPAPGRHWFWHAGRPFSVSFYRSKDTKGWSHKRSQTLYFRTIGRNQKFLQDFVKEIVSSHEKRVRATSRLYVLEENYWERVENYTPRLFDSVILHGRDKESLVRDIEKFKLSRQRYRELGVPYHRGYLFYGPPGTGKTSLISAVSARFAMSIYAINLADLNDKTLMKAIHDVPPGSVVLFEDIDCIKMTTARPDSAKAIKNRPSHDPEDERSDPLERFNVTLSGLLNVLDGFYAPEDVLFFMTTNRMESLDRALLRPGRIDYRLFLGKATDQQKIELYRRFFPHASLSDAQDFAGSHPLVETMAEYQGLLLQLDAREAQNDFCLPVDGADSSEDEATNERSLQEA
ncbi:MAG TPA: AAA family ATPase [Candidatus Acidoferrales bacterium]|nr:AAA family ATPase [Candidatus Acidoferrales bacterium]